MVPSLKIEVPSLALARRCDFVAVEVFGRLIENGEQNQAYQAAVQLFLEFAGVGIVHGLILYAVHY